MKYYLGGISRNLESNILNTLGENRDKSNFSPFIDGINWNLKLEPLERALNAYTDLRYRLSGKS